MVITKTPFRISFFGGGTDFPQWYKNHGGAVLSTTIDKYCYISTRVLPPYFREKHRILWSHVEAINEISHILHPAVRACLQYMGCNDLVGYEIHHQADLPARTGMGSSSAFVVGLLHALRVLQGKSVEKTELAQMAIELEQSVLNESVGSQDQVATAHGGFNLIHFFRDGEIRVTPVDAPQNRIEELHAHLMLFSTGTSRNGVQIASQTIANLSKREAELKSMRQMVDKSVDILHGTRNIKSLGKLLHDSWVLKQSLAPQVSNAEIDGIYQTALKNGAVGGKLLGSGGSGFMLFFVPPTRQKELKRALAHIQHVPFQFEKGGSTLILNSAAQAPNAEAAQDLSTHNEKRSHQNL